MPKAKKCTICGGELTGLDGMVHMLVSHGPNNITNKRSRTRARASLPRIHRRLEKLGLDEVQTHKVLTAVAEELRLSGLI